MDLKARILGADDRPVRPLEVPEWGGTVYLRTLSGAERDELEGLALSLQKNPEKAARGFRARVAALVLGDEQGRRIFADSDVSALADKSGKVLERVRDEGMRFNGWTADEVETLVGNSESDRNGASGSGSPSPSDRLSTTSSNA